MKGMTADMSGISNLVSLCEETGMQYRLHEPMKTHTTFNIGGNADIFITPSNIGQLVMLNDFTTKNSMPAFIIGNGSNLLVSDEGVDGAIISLTKTFADIETAGEEVINCGSGVSLSRLCLTAYQHSLTGLEFAYGIPGSVGGGIYMNAGAYGGEIKDVLSTVTHMDINGTSETFTVEKLAMSYRHSIYKEKKCLITKAAFKLKKGNRAQIKALMDDVAQKRKSKQPLEYPNAGSAFKRPAGAYAAELIDRCGLKGKRIGGAAVSEKHAGFIVNLGGATCRDVIELIKIVKSEVAQKTGYTMEMEIEFIGRKMQIMD